MSGQEVHDWIEVIRKRPGMFIGDLNETGLHNMVFGAVYFLLVASPKPVRSVQLIIERDKEFTIRLSESDLFTVEFPGWQTALLTSVFKPHSKEAERRSKLNDRIVMKSDSLHGDLELLAANALSEYFSLEFTDNGIQHKLEFQTGRLIRKSEAPAGNNTGAEIRFRVDASIMKGDAHFERLVQRFDSLMMFLPETRLFIADLRNDIEVKGKKLFEGKEIYYPGEVDEFIRSSGNNVSRTYTFTDSYPTGNSRLTVSFGYGYSSEGQIHSFINYLPTPQGGAHVDLFMKDFPGLISGHYNDLPAAAPFEHFGLDLDWEQVSKGMTCIISLESSRHEFEGSTRTRGSDEHACNLMDRILMQVNEHLWKLEGNNY